MWYSAGKPVPFWQKQFHVPTHSDLGFPSICDSFSFSLFLFYQQFYWNITSTAYILCIVIVQLLSCVQLFVTSWMAAGQVSLSLTITQSLLKLMSIELVMSSNHLILCRPLLLLPSILPRIRVFSNESGDQGIGVSTSASALQMNILGWFPLRLTGLISFQSRGLSRVFSSTTVGKHQFFRAQPSLWSNSHLYMTTGKTIGLTMWIFVSKVMFLLLNILSIFVIVFLPRSKHLLISWLQSPSAVILETKKINSVIVSFVSPWLNAMKWLDRMLWSLLFEC